jgi:hypothetical protein
MDPIRIEWLGVAEGASNDARGALTLVGINRPITISPSLPAEIRASVVLVIELDPERMSDVGDVSVVIALTAPSGDEVFRGEGLMTIGAFRYTEIPGTLELAFPMLAPASEYGVYHLAATVESSIGSAAAEKSLLVVNTRAEIEA